MPFHWTQQALDAGAILEAGAYGKMLCATGQSHKNSLRESILEHIRAQEFPNMPSRLQSSFFFHTKEQALTYLATRGLSSYALYEVEIVSSATVVADVDFRRVDPSGSIGLEWARAYWRGDLMPPVGNDHLFRQRFTASDLRVLRNIAF